MQLTPKQNIAESIGDLKSYIYEKDKYLVCKIDEKKQFVFKTSKLKMQLVCDMQPDGINCMKEKDKSFVTLTASTQHLLLPKQMRWQYKRASTKTENIKLFKWFFN